MAAPTTWAGRERAETLSGYQTLVGASYFARPALVWKSASCVELPKAVYPAWNKYEWDPSGAWNGDPFWRFWSGVDRRWVEWPTYCTPIVVPAWVHATVMRMCVLSERVIGRLEKGGWGVFTRPPRNVHTVGALGLRDVMSMAVICGCFADGNQVDRAQWGMPWGMGRAQGRKEGLGTALLPSALPTWTFSRHMLGRLREEAYIGSSDPDWGQYEGWGEVVLAPEPSLTGTGGTAPWHTAVRTALVGGLGFWEEYKCGYVDAPETQRSDAELEEWLRLMILFAGSRWFRWTEKAWTEGRMRETPERVSDIEFKRFYTCTLSGLTVANDLAAQKTAVGPHALQTVLLERQNATPANLKYV